MIVSMQGNWTIRVKSKDAAFAQRFVISGAATHNGSHPGTVGTTVAVTGTQWSIAIQNDPGTGFQSSDTSITFPQQVGNNYEFDIRSNDAGADADFNDLILTCSTPVTINDFIVYGNVTLYSGSCILNPCRRRGLYVIETSDALSRALNNPKLREVIAQLYPERIPVPVDPNPPDPPFRPIVLDLFGESSKPQLASVFRRVESAVGTKRAKTPTPDLAASNFELLRTVERSTQSSAKAATSLANDTVLAKAIDGVLSACEVDPAPNVTLSFDEYDRTAAELAGGPYAGTGPRRVLGDAVTDMNGNYIFRFSFDMTVPNLEDAGDIAPGEDVNVVLYPDVIVKILGSFPATVRYESAPYYNILNLRRIDLCLPKSTVQVSSVCFNGSLVGQLGDVFIGGNQNTSASTAPASLRRHGFSNFLEANGKISVNSSLALFNVDCAAWTGTIDVKGCMYDAAKTAVQNAIRTYTIRIRRAGIPDWTFVSDNYKHPKYSKRNDPGYIGDDVGPFPTALQVDGGPPITVPAYTNIQREIFVDGVDWDFPDFDRYMQLHTSLYDTVAGVTTPGTFYIRVDGYDAAGSPVANATDMVALYIHNLPLNFQLVGPSFSDPAIVNSGCGLYRLTDAQMNTPMQLAFKANDPFGFVNAYDLTIGRCPAPMLALQVNTPNPPISDTPAGATTLASGDAAGNVHSACPGDTGTLQDFATLGLVNVDIQPALSEGGWIKPSESFTVLSFGLSANMRVTNGKNSGLSGLYLASASIFLERLSP